MEQLRFRGYITNDPLEAIEAYKIREGVIPTILLVRQSMELIQDNDLIIRSRWGASDIILASHEITRDIINESEFIRQSKHDTAPQTAPQTKNNIEITKNEETPDKEIKQQNVRKKYHKKTNAGNSKCPLCHAKITSYENLGTWWGWAHGIKPPYWDSLRSYVFQRDNYTCQICNKPIKVKFLVAHHIIPKEQGGPDSAKNLMTVCVSCHPDNKPIYPDEELANL